jgi:hypothetical protein
VTDAATDAASPEGETSWEVIAAKRRLRDQLEEEIAKGTNQAILDSRKAGVSTAALAELWKVTPTWIYTRVPARGTAANNTKKNSAKA